MSQFIFTWGMLILIWLGFTGSVDLTEVTMGAILSLIISLYAFRTFTSSGLRFLSPKKLIYILKYLVVFLVELIKSNIDVALRVVNPTLPINPEIVAFETSIDYNIKQAGNLRSMIFGGEGLFLATLHGTGRVWLQSLPFSRLADRILELAPRAGGRQMGEGSVIKGVQKLFER